MQRAAPKVRLWPKNTGPLKPLRTEVQAISIGTQRVYNARLWLSTEKRSRTSLSV
jgi:hypothetical protein